MPNFDQAAVAPRLLTGFSPFDGATINPSWEAVRRLTSTDIRTVRIPT